MKHLANSLLILTTLSALSIWAPLHAAQTPKSPPILQPGNPAPPFTLPGTDGKDHRLSDYNSAKYIVLVFTCNHCPDARAVRQRLNTFSKNYAAKGVQVIAISSAAPQGVQLWENGYTIFGDSFEEMKAVSKEHKLHHPYLYDGDTQATTAAYGAQSTPHCFILSPTDENASRTVLYQGQFDDGHRTHGPATPDIDSVVQKNIDLLLSGKPLTRTNTRAYGCSTKWAWKKELVAQRQDEWEALPVTLDSLTADQAKTLAQNKTNRVKVINIWSTTCGPCVAEFPQLIETYRRYQRRPLDLITISIDPAKDQQQVLDFLKDQHLPTPAHAAKALKKEQRSSNNYHYTGKKLDPLAEALNPAWNGTLPHTLIIAPGGKITYQHNGLIQPLELRKAIHKTLHPNE